MKTITIAAALWFTITDPFNGSAATVQPDPELARAMEAAGGLTTLMALCPDFKMPQEDTNRLLILEAALKMNPAYVDFFDRGVAMMTAEALNNPHVCRDQLENFETY